MAHTDIAILRPLISKTRFCDWAIVPLEYVQDVWWAAVWERYWWYMFRRWVITYVAPGIPDDENPKNRGWLNIKVLRLLKDFSC